MIRKISALILAVSIPVFILLTSTQILVEWDAFFLEQYQVNGVVEATHIQLDELMRVTEEIQDYLLGDREDFDIIGEIDGKSQHIFNEREIIHMEDVQELFRGGILLRNICGYLILITSVFLWRENKLSLFKSMKYSAIGFLSLGITLALLLISNFNKYFNIFHEIFFRNDFWILDPNNSVLINMVNLNFFMNIAARILGISLLGMLIMGIIGIFMLKKEGRYVKK